jgi:hypothetical protein
MIAIMSCVQKGFKVADLEIERLLSDWRWLCPAQMSLLAKNLFGELFLMDETGAVLWLNTTVGKLSKVADSKVECLEMGSACLRSSPKAALPIRPLSRTFTNTFLFSATCTNNCRLRLTEAQYASSSIRNPPRSSDKRRYRKCGG